MADKWNAVEIDQVQTAIFLKRGQMRRPAPMPDSPRGSLPGGLADFRGFPLMEVTAVAIADADFTGSRAPKNQFGAEQSIQLMNVIAERSVFDRAGKFHRLDGRFNACRFHKITTRSASISGTFTDCDFSGANFKMAYFSARFIRCRFHSCNLHLAGWPPSSFQDCEFAGSGIHDLFADVRDAALAGERATFSVTVSKVYPGEFR